MATFTIFPVNSAPVQNWNIQTLKEYVDLRFQQVQVAVDKAESATEKRFESVNEFRSTLADQQRTFVPRPEYEAAHQSLENRVNAVTSELEKIQNQKQGGNIVYAYVISVISLIGTVIVIVVNIGKFRKP